MAIFEIAKNGIGSKKYFVKLIYLISRVFLAWTFLNFLAHCVSTLKKYREIQTKFNFRINIDLITLEKYPQKQPVFLLQLVLFLKVCFIPKTVTPQTNDSSGSPCGNSCPPMAKSIKGS